MKVFGFVPARMAASRFPGKPLFPILGRPMVEHVFLRAQKFPSWDGLFLATCDPEIADLGKTKDWPTLMTSASHTRCLDRIAEAVTLCSREVDAEDIVVCVQGDEPMLHHDMISAVVNPLLENPKLNCTVLGMAIEDEGQFLNPDTVKIIHNEKNEVLYTSRSPVPYVKPGQFSAKLGARRIYGIFAFRWKHLKAFTELPENYLERVESCDSNRLLDSPIRQTVAPYPCRPSFSVDSPSDIKIVEEHMKQDPLHGTY